MLDESILVFRPVYCVLGAEFFGAKHEHGVNFVYALDRIQQLFRFAGVWKYMFAASNADEHEVYDQLVYLGVPFALLLSRETMSDSDCRRSILAANVVYAPAFCRALDVYPALTPPSSAERLLDVLEYFATTGVPFSPEAYKQNLA